MGSCLSLVRGASTCQPLRSHSASVPIALPSCPRTGRLLGCGLLYFRGYLQFGKSKGRNGINDITEATRGHTERTTLLTGMRDGGHTFKDDVLGGAVDIKILKPTDRTGYSGRVIIGRDKRGTYLLDAPQVITYFVFVQLRFEFPDYIRLHPSRHGH